MRLQSIEIENITSLRGKHFIDFEDILKDDELFAITGPTGSGKSSILSAISLALYGKNYKKSLDSKDFVTLGQASASIKLNFNTKGENYCAAWTLKVLKKNGDPIKKPSPQRILTREGVAIEESADQIIGLTFDQFIRSVVLNQGQFSKFITSNFSERRKILERLYSENEISEINKKLRENVNSIKQDIELLEVKLDQSLPYSEEEITTAKQNLPNSIEKRNILEKQVNNFTKLNQYLREFTDSSYKRLDLIEKSNKNQYLLDICNDKRNKLLLDQKEIGKTHENFKIKYDQQMEKYNQARVHKTKLTGLNQSIESSNKKIQENNGKISDLRTGLEEKAKASNEISETLKELNQDNPFISLDKVTLDNIEISTADILSTIQNNRIHKENLLENEESLHSLEKQGKVETSQLEKLRKDINNLSLTSTGKEYSSDTLQALQEKQTEIEKNIQKANDSLTKLSLYEDEIEKIGLKLKKIESSNTLNLLKQKETELLSLEKTLKDRRQIFSLQRNSSILLALINESIESSTCSLCEQDVSKVNFDNIIKRCNHASDEVTQENITKLENELTEHISETKALENQNSSEIKEKDQLLEEQTQLKLKINSFEAEKENQKNFVTKKEIIKDTIDHFQKLTNEISLKKQQVQNLRDDYQKKKTNHDKLKGLIDANSKVISDKILDINNLAKTSFEESNIELIKSSIHESKEYLAKNKDLETINVFIGQINKQIEEYNTSNLNLKEQNKESEQLQSQLQLQLREITGDSLLEELVASLKEKLESHNDQLKNINKLVAKEDNEYTRLITMKESIFDQSKGHENTIMTTLGHLEVVLNKLLDHKSKNHETNIFISKTLQLKSYIEDLPTVEAYNRANIMLVAPEMESLRDELEETLQTISVYEEKINLFDTKAKEQKRDKELLSKKKDIQKRFTNLVEVLGKNKDEFRNFVLGFIEKQLILATNNELDTICDGRYEMIQKESSNGHEFFILDSWNGGLERKISTLSGGETFLVSLAMALSLAEMTRGQVDIDCFFIDEGFGSLDRDSIEDAYNALMSVRSRGKQIGIISHVKELTSRIGANINLNKSNDGQSKIELIFN